VVVRITAGAYRPGRSAHRRRSRRLRGALREREQRPVAIGRQMAAPHRHGDAPMAERLLDRQCRDFFRRPHVIADPGFHGRDHAESPCPVMIPSTGGDLDQELVNAAFH
jgi:hypothetical protein